MRKPRLRVPWLDLHPALSAPRGLALGQPAPQPPGQPAGSLLPGPFLTGPLKAAVILATNSTEATEQGGLSGGVWVMTGGFPATAEEPGQFPASPSGLSRAGERGRPAGAWEGALLDIKLKKSLVCLGMGTLLGK